MGDITSPTWLYIKGALFVLLGMFASIALLLEHPTIKVAVLLCVAIWAFARAYYFAFYVIEHYVDRSYRYAGLVSFLRYTMKRGRGNPAEP